MDEFEISRSDGLVTLTAWHGVGARPSVPSGVEAIGDDAFSGRRVQSVELPQGLRVIGRRAFEKCARLEAVTLPSSVERVELEAFNGCSSLRRVSLGEGLRVIQPRAFWYCASLSEITLPASVTLIASRAFEGCSALRRVTVLNPGAEMDEYVFNETPYWNRLNALAQRCTVGRLGATDECPPTLALPEGATHIDTWAYSKSRIRAARLPSSLRTVGMNAFRDCKELTEVSMSPNTYYNYTNRLEPGDGIFAGCSSLKRVVLRGALKNYIWHDAKEPVLLRGFDPEKTFMGCTSLRSMEAWEVPLSAFPDAWRRFALNGFLEDGQRESHYLPAVAEEYHAALLQERPRLLSRAQNEAGFSLCQYLVSRQWLDQESFETVFRRASQLGDARTLSVLLEYRRRCLGQGKTGLENALEELDGE